MCLPIEYGDMDAAQRRLSVSAGVNFIAVIVLAQLALTVPLAFVLNVGQDDSYTLHTTAYGISYAYHQAISFEQNAPLYFVIMTIWRHILPSAVFARIFSVLCAAAAVTLVPRIVNRYLPGTDVRWPTLALAFNPFLIYTALEIRVYALIVLLSAALLVAGFEAFYAGRVRTKWVAAYAVLCALSLYTQYYLLFLIVAQGICLLAARRKSFWWFAAASGVALAAFAPMVAVLPSQMANFREYFSAPHSVFGSLKVLLAILMRYVIAFEGLPHIKVIAALAIAGAAAAALLLRRWMTTLGDALLPAITAIATLIFATAIYVTHEHVLNRHVASLLLPSTLSVYAGFTFFREPARARMTWIWSTLSLLVAVASLFVTYRALAKPGDWIRVDAYLQERVRAGQPIAVFQAENALPLEYYYHGPGTIVPIPQGLDFRVYDVSKFIVRNEAELARVFPHSRNGVWLIDAGECKAANIDFGCDVLESYVAKYYRVVSRADFYESSVRLLLPR